MSHTQALTPQYPTGTARIILVLTAISCALLELIDATVVNVSLREISGSIGATTTEIAWVVTAYAISNVIIIPLTGMFSSYFGRKNYFTASVIIFTFASLMCGLSTSLWTLVFWRFVQGLGGGGLLSTAQTIIMGAFPPEKIGMATAIFGMGIILGPTFGPTIPKILHQTWKDRNLPVHSAELTEKWQSLHPGWTHKVWTDAECDEFVTAVWPELEKLYRSFPYPIQRFDMIRYLILHTYGGVYLDLDMMPVKSLDFLTATQDFVVCKEPAEAATIHKRDYIISNAFMASPAQHKFINFLLNDLATHKTSFKDRNNTILDTTGPFFMSRVYKKRPEGVRLLNPEYFMPLSYKEGDACVSAKDSLTFTKKSHSAYGIHLFEGSWWRPKEGNVRPLYSTALARVTGTSPIPKLIHLTWKTKELPPVFEALVSKMRTLHPDWSIKIWTDAEMMEFVK
jgi:mannosyltransferase OCH1-like enzyme